MAGDLREKIELDRALRDGYEVHQAALRRGLNVTLLPRQVLIASRPDASGELSFVHGVPETSRLSAVTFAQDKRIRRALLVDAGLPIPTGGAYSIGRGVTIAKERLVRRAGYPLVIKPAVGDSPIEVQDWITNEQELDAAIEYFWTPATERPAFVRAAYGLTETREPGEVDGRLVAPPGFRVLMEQRVTGQYLRFVVVGGEVRSILHCPGGPWGAPDKPHRDVTADTHASLAEMAVAAFRAVPGLAIAAVDIVASGGYGQAVSEQDVWIVELSDRPWLAAQASISETLSAGLGDDILTRYAADTATPLREPLGDLAVDFHAESIPDVAVAESTLSKACYEHGLSGQFAVRDHLTGIIDGTVRGPAARIAYLAELLSAGELNGHRAMLVEERPTG